MVQPNTSSCTKGIWMWNKIEKHRDQQGEEFNLIILDTEVKSGYLIE